MSNLYNMEQKLRYIKEKENAVVLPNNYLKCQFRHVSEQEEELGKDLCNFNLYDIVEYYKIMNQTSLEYLTVLNSQFSMYTQWCLQENLVDDNQNHFFEVNIEILKNCLNKAIIDKRMIDRSQICEWCDSLPNPSDAFILLSLFEFGKSKDFKNIVELTSKDIDQEKSTFRLCDGREVKVSSKLMELAVSSLEIDTYYSMSNSGVKTMPLISDGHIVKNYPNVQEGVSDFQKGRRCYNKYTRALAYVGADQWCNANSIVEAGKIYTIKKMASEKGISPIDYINKYGKEIENQYGCKIVKSVFLTKYRDYLV